MQFKLKVLWLTNLLGFAIDQKVTNKAYPLTSFYFWPKTEAWDQLKLELESKSWIPEKEKIKLLNSISELINYWRQNRNSECPKEQFTDVEFVKVQDRG